MAEQDTPATKQLVLQKIYLKDLSFESPKAPAVFNTAGQPQTQLNIRSGAREIGPQTQEVTLTLTVEAKNAEQTLFLVEITQAGIFLIEGYTDQERAALVGAYCPGTLYPYVREAISDVVSKGGFPQLLLQPINFDALYMQALQQREQGQAGLNVEATADSSNGGQSNGGQSDSNGGQSDGGSPAKASETH